MKLTFQALNMSPVPGGAGTILKLTVGLTKLTAAAISGDGKVMDAVEVASVMVPANATRATFTVPAGTVADGWTLFTIVSPNGEPTIPMWAYVNHAGIQVPPQTVTPVQAGSYDITHGLQYAHALVPAKYAPKVMPLPPREFPPFNTALPRAQLFREDVIPVRGGNIRRPVVNKHGIMTTANYQSYHWDRLIHKDPYVHLLEGPRGIATGSMFTHLTPSHGGGAWFTTPWNHGNIAPDGTVRVFSGFVHPPTGGQWQDAGSNVILKGDWSNVAPDRRRYHGIWGMAIDRDSTALDPNATPVVIGGVSLQPHVTGVRMFKADLDMNAIRMSEFSKNDVNAPPVIYDYIEGLKGPFDVICDAGKLYVSERGADRISIWDAPLGSYKGKFLGVLVEAQVKGLAGMKQHRVGYRIGTAAQIDAQDCVFPEGMFLHGRWLSYGSLPMQAIHRINLDTGEIQKRMCRPTFDGNSKYLKFAQGDGTFGPDGTYFTSTWSIAYHGMPVAHLPGGGIWDYVSNQGDKLITRGRGGVYAALSYSCAPGVGKGRLFASSAAEGLSVFSKALNTDPLCDFAKYNRGAAEWKAKLYPYVNPFWGFDLPWGESSDMDYFLEWNGNVRPVNP